MTFSRNRPWPAPRSPWIMQQAWRELLFLHYPVSPSDIAPHLPSGLKPDLYDGSAWISIVPFQVRNVRILRLPSIPVISAFNELNIRTYVTLDQKPGVYFFSLDAHSWPTVWAGRNFFHVPYRHASMSLHRERGTLHFASRRTANPDFQFVCSYTPNTGDAEISGPGSLNYFLAERYCLYSEHRGKLYRGEIDHNPWKLRQTSFDVRHNTMLEPLGLVLPQPVLAHYSEQGDVHFWPINRVRV